MNEFEELKQMHVELMDSIKDYIDRNNQLETRVTKLESTKSKFFAFGAGALFVCSLVSSSLTAWATWMIKN